jgi:hypothetical protein
VTNLSITPLIVHHMCNWINYSITYECHNEVVVSVFIIIIIEPRKIKQQLWSCHITSILTKIFCNFDCWRGTFIEKEKHECYLSPMVCLMAYIYLLYNNWFRNLLLNNRLDSKTIWTIIYVHDCFLANL